MSITELVRSGEKKWIWADTKKSARITRNIQEPVKLDLANVHPDWKTKPIEFARLHRP